MTERPLRKPIPGDILRKQYESREQQQNCAIARKSFPKSYYAQSIVIILCKNPSEYNWAMVWGCKTYGGRKTNRQCTLQKKILQKASGALSLGFPYRKNRAATPEGGGKRTRQRGFQNLFFGRGDLPEVFLPPLFFHRPMPSSEILPQKRTFFKKLLCARCFLTGGYHPNGHGYYSKFSKLNLPLHLQCNSNSSIPTIRSATNRAPRHGGSKTPHLHLPCNPSWLGTGSKSHLPLQCDSELWPEQIKLVCYVFWMEQVVTPDLPSGQKKLLLEDFTQCSTTAMRFHLLQDTISNSRTGSNELNWRLYLQLEGRIGICREELLCPDSEMV